MAKVLVTRASAVDGDVSHKLVTEVEMMRAGTVVEAVPDSGDWIFVDMGFAQSAKSCGLLIGDGEPANATFAGLCETLAKHMSSAKRPVNLVIEAPLSVAFNARGNPTGRSVERRGSQTRYWYTGLGCAVMVAATYLIRSLVVANPPVEIRLFEGLVSFKERGVISSHCADVEDLRTVVWSGAQTGGMIVEPQRLAILETDRLISAFAVADMDFGIPPVIVIGG